VNSKDVLISSLSIRLEDILNLKLRKVLRIQPLGPVVYIYLNVIIVSHALLFCRLLALQILEWKMEFIEKNSSYLYMNG